MSDTQDPLAALLAARLAADPGFLDKVMSMAIAARRPETTEDHPPPTQLASTQQETRVPAVMRQQSPQRSLSTASTIRIDDPPEVTPNHDKVTSLRPEKGKSLQPKNR
ncbi:hypothetical protein RSAG8_11731, partial [Rhizoctonia solani AG-8 WAC10335]